MWRNLLVQAIYQITVLLLNFNGKAILNLNHESTEHATKVKNSLVFNAFVFCQIFNDFNARKPDQINVFSGISKDKFFIAIVGSTFILQIIIVEFLGSFFQTIRLSWSLWIVSFVIGIISWPFAMVGKYIPVPRTPFAKVCMKPYQKCIATCSGRH